MTNEKIAKKYFDLINSVTGESEIIEYLTKKYNIDRRTLFEIISNEVLRLLEENDTANKQEPTIDDILLPNEQNSSIQITKDIEENANSFNKPDKEKFEKKLYFLLEQNQIEEALLIEKDYLSYYPENKIKSTQKSKINSAVFPKISEEHQSFEKICTISSSFESVLAYKYVVALFFNDSSIFEKRCNNEKRVS